MAALRHPELRESYNRQYRALRDRVAAMVDGLLAASGHPDPASMSPIADAFVVLQTGLSIRRLMDPDGIPASVFPLVFEALVRGMSPRNRRGDVASTPRQRDPVESSYEDDVSTTRSP